jgi:hypothetical protein
MDVGPSGGTAPALADTSTGEMNVIKTRTFRLLNGLAISVEDPKSLSEERLAKGERDLIWFLFEILSGLVPDQHETAHVLSLARGDGGLQVRGGYWGDGDILSIVEMKEEGKRPTLLVTYEDGLGGEDA